MNSQSRAPGTKVERQDSSVLKYVQSSTAISIAEYLPDVALCKQRELQQQDRESKTTHGTLSVVGRANDTFSSGSLLYESNRLLS